MITQTAAGTAAHIQQGNLIGVKDLLEVSIEISGKFAVGLYFSPFLEGGKGPIGLTAQIKQAEI